MDKPSFKLVGAPCGHHSQYTFYKALRITGPDKMDRIIALGDFFFVKIWQDSELISIGELQLLWTDRVSDQTLVALRLYFLPENTPEGRNQHGEDEVLCLNEKVVLKAEDLLSWISSGAGWRRGVKAVWRGACAPPSDDVTPDHSDLNTTSIDFADVQREKDNIEADRTQRGVVVFSFARYCRYRAVAARLAGLAGLAEPAPAGPGLAWLRDSLLSALGGYAADNDNTTILYTRDTFEYPELEGHEFVCNHLLPRMKGRGRRRKQDAGSDNEPPTPRRVSLRNGADRQSDEDRDSDESPEDAAFSATLRQFYKERNQTIAIHNTLTDLSLRNLYSLVTSHGGYETICRQKRWRALTRQRATRLRTVYERYLLPFENHERQNGKLPKINGKIDKSDEKPIDTIDVADSPLREPERESPEKQLDSKDDICSNSAEQLNKEFLDSLPKSYQELKEVMEQKDAKEKPKLTIKPVEKLLEPTTKSNLTKLFDENKSLVADLTAKHNVMDLSKVIDEIESRQLSDRSSAFLADLAQRLNLGSDPILKDLPKAQESTVNALSSLSGLGDKYNINGLQQNGVSGDQNPRPVGRSSLRHVRVKPTRPPQNIATVAPMPPVTSESKLPPPSMSIANNAGSDDEIVEVPYKPKTPEIIDLDEYPESPQSQIKKKKLDILKERGLEVTAIPPTWPGVVPPPVPLVGGLTPPIMLNPAMQHQIMTQASLFQMYNIIPQNYANGIQPPRVIQSSCLYGAMGPEKTVYGNPKDPFMPPPHILQGTPIKPQRNLVQPTQERPHDVLDLTCKTIGQKPSVEILKLPQDSNPQNLTKNYTLIDGKAVVGSNLEITLVNPKTPQKNRPPQKRSSNGKFVSTKTPTPPKEFASKPFPSPKKPSITIPSYQIRDEPSPTSSTGSRDSNPQYKPPYSQILDLQNLQKSVPMSPFIDPFTMSALYSSIGQMDPRQLAIYRDLMMKGYGGMVNPTPTTRS